MTGYDISKQFSLTIGSFWQAKCSQIYPEIKKLLAEGLVDVEEISQNDRPDKKIYSLTDKGRAEFLEWLNYADIPEPVVRDVFKLKMYFCEQISRPHIFEILTEYELRHRKKQHLLHADIERLFGGRPPAELDGEELGDYLCIRQAQLREDAYIQWIKECREIIQKKEET